MLIVYDIVLNTSRLSVSMIFCIAQGSIMTRLRCGGKYGTSLLANLLLSPTVNKFLRSATFLKFMIEYQVAHFLWLGVYITAINTKVN